MGYRPLVDFHLFSLTKQFQFPTRWDSATFRDIRKEVSSLSWDKGTTGQAKNLAKGRDGPGQPKFGTGRDSQNPVRDAGQNGTEQKRTF